MSPRRVLLAAALAALLIAPTDDPYPAPYQPCPRLWATIRTVGHCPFPEFHYTTIVTTPWHHADPQQKLWAT